MSVVGKRELSERERRERTQARVGLASNALGITAGGAALVATSRNPALRDPSPRNAGPVTGRVARALRLSDPRARRLVRAGAAGALGLQAANLAGDVVANRVLARESGFEKRDDRFLADYRLRISPAAEVGYQRLRRERNRRDALAGVSAGGALGAGALTAALLRRKPVLAGIAAGSTVAGAVSAGGYLTDRRRLESKMEQIRAKAREREGLGVYGVGRLVPGSRRSVEQSVSDASSPVRVSGNGVNLDGRPGPERIGKRNFDAEADRQRRLGLYAGLGVGGGLVLGDAARRRLNIQGSRLKSGGRRVRFDVPASRKGKAALAALALGSAAGVGGGVGAYRLGVSERNNPWR